MSNYLYALGIDMALTSTGWALFRIDIDSSENPVLERWGVIKSPSDHIRDKNGMKRLEAIYERGSRYYYELHELISKENAVIAAIETPFGSKNAAASMAMGIVYGCIIYISALHPYMHIRLVHPNDSKEMVAESAPLKEKPRRGRVSKTLVRHWVTRLHKKDGLGLEEPDHIYDAVAAFWVYWKGVKSRFVYQYSKKGKSSICEEIKDDKE